MDSINKVQLNMSPKDEIADNIETLFMGSEMSSFESGFLCGLLKDNKPKKILEVGVAAGGSTAIMLQCLSDMGYEYKMYSVDRSKQYYRNPRKQTGFIGEQAKEVLNIKSHEYLLGDVLPAYIDYIGKDIDFLLLDTMHSLPGEILDFLIACPYLKKEAIVVLHDIALNQKLSKNLDATNVLYHSVAAKKIINFIPNAKDNILDFPNIGAFRVTDETMTNIINSFLSLTLNWKYMPSEADLQKYRNAICREYNQDLQHIFNSALIMNMCNMYPFPYHRATGAKKILIYGAGAKGRAYYYQLKRVGYLQELHIVDRNYDALGKIWGIPVELPTNINPTNADKCFITVGSYKAAEEIYSHLISREFSSDQIVYDPIVRD